MRFVKDYGTISKPLTQLLKKDVFEWNDKATKNFKLLKEVMTQPPVLALPDPNKQFALAHGIKAMLMQDGHPITHISKSLGLGKQALSIYRREMLAMLRVVAK